jgi:signal recognition particle receptor subunit alpha
MLDLACIFTTGGVILFWKVFCELGTDIVNEFIFNVLVQEKLNEKQWKIKNRVFIWRYDPAIKVVFLFAYQELFKALDFQEVLSYTKSYYKKTIWPDVGRTGDLIVYIPEFDVHFEKLMKAFAKKNQEARRSPDMKAEASNHQHQDDESDNEADENSNEKADVDNTQTQKPENEGSKKDGGPASILKASERTTNKSEETSPGPVRRVAFKEDESFKEKEKVEAKVDAQPSSDKKLTPKQIMDLKIQMQKDKKNKGKEPEVQASGAQPKDNRKWAYSERVSSKDMQELDYSKKFSQSGKDIDEKGDSPKGRSGYFDDDEELVLDYDIVSDDEKAQESKKAKKSGILSSFKNSFKAFTEGKTLGEDDLKKILDKFKDDLMAKNVAEEIARGIVESLKVKLLNHKMTVFSSATELVRQTLKETLTKIMTPKKTYDILSEANKAREKGQPYVIAFIGVNGVGKSTNLAKVAYLFKSQGFSVMFAACDNFRAGAVEQLKTHGRNLDIPVFDRGYKDEPHRIAREAIREAKSKRIDVVLIDTAGRMQNNEPLMRALATLVTINQPDLVVFIGEALVGNDGVDQLTNFNSALIKYSTEEKERREIDAVLISKFDTVDEKSRQGFNASWRRYFDDLCDRKAHLVLRNWAKIPQFEEG